MRHTLLAFLFLTLTATTQADSRNAVTWYERAYSAMDRLSEADWEALDAYRADPRGSPPTAVREALSRATAAVGHARRGSRQSYADYRLNYDEGFSLKLPHLHRARQLARVLEADAFTRMADGDHTAAADRIAAIYRMGEHASQDRTIISSLVGQSVWQIGDGVLQTALDRGLLGPDAASAVLRGARDMPADDPFGYVESLAMEQDVVMASMEQVLDADSGVTLADFLPAAAELPPEMAAMTPDDIRDDLVRYTDLMSEMAEVFAVSDPEAGKAELDRLRDEIQRGEHGQVALLVTTDLHKVFEWKIDGERKLAARIATLRGIAEGSVAAMTEANAALWYIRAARQLHLSEDLAALRAADADPEPSIDETLASLLDGAGDVFDLLREAAAMKRCDFAFAHPPATEGPALAPRYAAGLRDLLRLLVVDIVHRVQAGETDAQLDRLRQLWSMIVHLDGDPMYATAIMTHQAFLRAVDLTEMASGADAVSPEQLAELYSVANRLSRGDPFGYAAATVRARENLISHCKQITRVVTVEAADRFDQRIASAGGLDGDHLLFISVVLDTTRHAQDKGPETNDAVLSPLDDLYDLDALARSRAEVPKATPLIVDLDFEPIQAWDVPSVGAIGTRTRDARRDLREGLRGLEPAKTVEGETTP